jgi:RNA polymerase sigma-70 factor (ECF subfamily)
MQDGGTEMQAALAPASAVDWESGLVQRARKGDTRAFERLYREHAGRVHGLCLRMTRDAAAAEDCVQEAFIRAWRALERFESRASFGTWLHRIAVNVVLERRRRPSFAAEVTKDEDATDVDEPWSLDTPAEVSEIEATIASLPEGARDVLVLCGVYGYTHGEAARMLGVAEGTCKAQLHRARSLMKERLYGESR